VNTISDSQPSDFDLLAREYLADLMAESPANATFQGWDGHDDESPDLSAAGIAARHTREDRWYARYLVLGDGDLTDSQRIDRDAVLAQLRGSKVMRDWESHKRQPDIYLSAALMGVFTLFLRRPMDEHDLVTAACARLAEIPRLLDEGRANLDPGMVPPLFVMRALGQCQAGTRYVSELLPADVADAADRQRLVDAAGPAAKAFEDFAVFLSELGDRARGDAAIGEARYSGLLQQAELLGYGAATLHAKGQGAWDELDAEMRELARQIDPEASGWRPVVEAANAEHPTTPEEMLAGYRDWTARCRRFLVEQELVTFADGEECEVEPSPAFQRPVIAVASYYQPPAFKPSLRGRFNVPYPPDGVSDDEVQQRLSNNGWHAMPTISAHEAYPGHHWHLVTMQQAPMLRQVNRSSYFAEGWGLYAERVMREHGFFADPKDELSHLDLRIFRAARIIVDTALHTGEMGFDEAVDFMQTRASLSEPNARAEVIRYLAWPTQAASYLTGCLEIERIREAYLSSGRGGLRDFHDTLARSGCLPIALAERAVLG
jgi:uncharacterized protein (DUF885 family)